MTLLEARKTMIDKLEIKTAHPLDENEVRRANKIADSAGEKFIKKLLTENGGSIPDAHVPLHLQALREKKVEEHALSQSRQSSPTVRLPPWE